MMSKSPAQLKNEAEVRRIMEERGYSPTSSKKKAKKSFGSSFSFLPLIVGIIIVGLLVGGGWVFLQNNPFDTQQDDNQPTDAVVTDSGTELTDFRSCLSAVDMSEIALDDSEFWMKYIDRYEQTIACYDKYPSVADSSEKAELQNRLAELQENSKSAEANDVAYRTNMAQIDNELAQNLARIEEESKAWDAELEKRVQERQEQSAARNAQYAEEQAEREAKQAKCNAFKAEYPDADTFKSKNGNLDELYNNWQVAQSAYYSAADSYNSYISKYGAEHSAEYLTRLSESLDKKRAEMNAAQNAWSSSNTRLSNEYNSKYREACL